MSGALVNLITDFSAPAADHLGIGLLRSPKPAGQVVQQEQVRTASAQDRQAELIQMIEAQVRAEEREIARHKLDQALTAERERHREELALQRHVWVEQEARQISAQFVEAMGNLEQVLSDRVGRILVAIIPEALRCNAIADFKEALETILSHDSPALLKITGPEDMLNAIKARFMLRDGIIDFVPNESVEVTLIAGDTSVQTQLGSWAARLQEALRAE